MNFELYIENLGAIEKAEITINPLTILAGENGTGKSFVTKFLYSVLNVLMRDVYKMELLKIIDEMENNHKSLKDFMEQNLFSSFGMFLVRIRDKINRSSSFKNDDFNNELIILSEFINGYNQSFEEFYKSTYSKQKAFVGLSNIIGKSMIPESYLNNESNKFTYENNIFLMGLLYKYFSNFIDYFCVQLKNKILQELKLNFQISNIGQIIKKGKEKLIFEIKNIVKIEIFGDDLIVKNFQITNDLSKINRLTFFESPIYWRLSMELIENSSRPKNYYLSDKISDERLTGVPKYFLDLRELLFSRFEKGEKEPFIEQCANDLQKSLNGKFNTESYDLSFETNQGKTIGKNLVSFGMTNLGILQAVLNKNIINKGSFVFIDEPESNLHPEWQAVLADILVKLAENGVFVVITTHSSDMLKALDVISQERKNNDKFISVNYFEKNGYLCDLDNNELSPIRFARSKLLDTYENLMMREYLL